MRRFEIGGWVVRNPKNCAMTWEGYNNTPVQITSSRFELLQDIAVDLFPGRWWAAELFSPSSPPNMNLKEWL